MNFEGRKVLSVNVGSTHFDPAVKKWYYTILINGKAYVSTNYNSTEKGARQAMREETRRLRKKHMV